MKCELVQILTVAMILGQIMSMFKFDSQELKKVFDSMKTKNTINNIQNARLTEHKELELIDVLYNNINYAIKHLSTGNCLQFDSQNAKKIYTIVDKLLDLRENILEYKFKNKFVIVDDIDENIDRLKIQLEEKKKDLETYIKNKIAKRKQINMEIDKIENPEFHSNAKIPLQRNRGWIEAIYFKLTGKDLQLEQRKRVIREEEVLDGEIKYAQKILHRISRLTRYITRNDYLKIRYDTPDKKPIHKVIGIAVCSIVTLCIILLIATRNKNQANTKVELLN